jgi:Tfp pilus assembly protein PilF
VISKDKANYNAWVFSGAAANDLGIKEQALASYQKAIEISPTQPTAWQGLAQFYEKHGAKSELISVYSELTKIFKDDPVKSFELSLKLANCLTNNNQFKKVAFNLRFSFQLKYYDFYFQLRQLKCIIAF